MICASSVGVVDSLCRKVAQTGFLSIWLSLLNRQCEELHAASPSKVVHPACSLSLPVLPLV